jgi:MoxR-like ATPase
LTPVASGADVIEMQQQAEQVRVEETVVDYLMAIVEKTRTHEHLALGVSPRGSMALYRAAQALALTEGLTYVTPDHIKRLVLPVFGHRLMANGRRAPGGGLAGRCAPILEEILHSVPVPI